MSAGPEGDPFAETGSEMMVALTHFDQTRGELYDTISKEAVKPPLTIETKNHLGELADLTSESFGDLTTAILNIDDDLPTKVTDIRRIWLFDEAYRAKELRLLAGCKRHFGPPTPRQLNRVFRDMLRETTAIDDTVMEAKAMYQESLDVDLARLFGHWEKACRKGVSFEALENIEYEALLRGAGKQALDVSKIAAGVTIGLLITKKLGKGHL